MKMIAWLIAFLAPCLVFAQESGYALDDAHNHDGTHVEGQENCGGNYMYPGDVARLGSHSFLILGKDGPDHLLLDHRSGTPPHTYQFILRVRVDPSEMETYHRLVKESKTSQPAVTTIYYDKDRKQRDRTFFCLHDLPKIFGNEKKAGDAFEKLFPIRATWQKDVDFEGAFPIEKTIVPQYDPLVIERKDVELVVYRYLPSYLEQSSFRKMIAEKGPAITSLFADAPVRHDEAPESAKTHSSYVKAGALEGNGETCSSDYYLKKVRPPKTRHAFLLLSEMGSNKVLATHLYDQSPQNYQTALELTLGEAQMQLYRKAKAASKTSPLFWTNEFFCMNEIRDLAKRAALRLSGTVYVNSDLQDFKAGQEVGSLAIAPGKVRVLVNRTLQSLMNPEAIARDVFGIVDITLVNPDVRVDARYASGFNFTGRPVNGYHANRCFLTEKAAQALSAVQKDVAREGYSLLVFDCYRPQRAVDEFVAWTKDAKDSVMEAHFYPDEPKATLVKRGYIAGRSGHSRGSTLDLTLVKIPPTKAIEPTREAKGDCRKPVALEKTGQLDMGTTYDCLSELATTASPRVSELARQNRSILKAAMEKHGFVNYAKEWWHFSLRDEPYKTEAFDFEVR